MSYIDDMELDDRRTYIGGSDIVGIMGIQSDSEYLDWTQVWSKFAYQVNVDLDEETNMHLKRGNVIEPHIEHYIRQNIDETINSRENFERYCIEHQAPDLDFDGDNRPHEWLSNPYSLWTNERAQIFAQDKKQPYLRGHVDGIGDNIIHEMKAPATYNVSMMRDYGFKKAYIVQCQFYMMITGKRLGMIHIWDYDQWKPITLEIKRDEYLHEQMRLLTRKFWDALATKEVPDMHWQKKMGYKHLFSPDELNSKIQDFHNAREMKKKWDKKEKELKPHIMTAVDAIWQDGSKDCKFTTKNWKVTASEQKRGQSSFRKLIIKENEIKQEVETSD